MRTCGEIYDLFIDLIRGKIKEVKLSFAEIEVLDRDRYYRDIADILRNLCWKNRIMQQSNNKDHCFIYYKEIIGG